MTPFAHMRRRRPPKLPPMLGALLGVVALLFSAPALAVAPLCGPTAASMSAPIPVLPVTGSELTAAPCRQPEGDALDVSLPAPGKLERVADHSPDQGYCLPWRLPCRAGTPLILGEVLDVPARSGVRGRVFRPPRG